MVWRVLAFRHNCSEVCRAKHVLLAEKNDVGTLLDDDTSFMGLYSVGFPEKKGASNRTSVFTAVTHTVRRSLMSRIY